MGSELLLETANHSVTLSLNGSQLAQQIVDSAPFESRTSTWGQEIYFAVPGQFPSNETTKDVSVGHVAYWPKGSSLAIFYGPTPKSDGQEPVPADEVQIVGEVSDGTDLLSEIEAGVDLTISKPSQ